MVVRLAGDKPFKRAPRWIKAEIAEVRVEAQPAVLALPTTFMNEAGHPVAALARYFSTPPERLVVVHDDIDLPFGKLRYQFGRGPGGHNGVTSVVRSLATDDLWRLKLGVGRPPGRMDPADFVLRRFASRERPDVDLMVVEGAEVVEVFAADGGEAAMQAAGEASRRIVGD